MCRGVYFLGIAWQMLTNARIRANERGAGGRLDLQRLVRGVTTVGGYINKLTSNCQIPPSGELVLPPHRIP